MPQDNRSNFVILPWLRRGLGTGITRADVSSSGGGANEKVNVWVSFEGRELNPVTSPPTLSVNLIGPGEISAIDARMIVRTWPLVNSNAAEPNFFPLIEFDQPDFPWRYTPVKEKEANRLRPWIALIALSDEELRKPGYSFVENNGTNLPLLKLPNTDLLPNLDSSWGWAHAQFSCLDGDDDATIAKAVRENPDRDVSRLLCMRKLSKLTAYRVFLVPTFMRGRLTGLGNSPGTTDAQAPAWAAGATNLELPVYYSWRFQTGADGDFKFYASKLQAVKADESSTLREININDAGSGLQNKAQNLKVETLLKPFGSQQGSGAPAGGLIPGMILGTQPATPGPVVSPPPPRPNIPSIINISIPRPVTPVTFVTPSPPVTPINPTATVRFEPVMAVNPVLFGNPELDAFKSKLETLLSSTANQVKPPLYGSSYVSNPSLSILASPDWFRDVNLDVGLRIAAGLGTQVIQKLQQNLIAGAWKQIEGLPEVNARLKNAQLGVEMAARLHKKHVKNANEESAIRFSSKFLSKLPSTSPAVPGTMKAFFAATAFGGAVSDPQWRKLSRGTGPIMRRQAGKIGVFKAASITRALSGTLPKAQPFMATAKLATLSEGLQKAGSSPTSSLTDVLARLRATASAPGAVDTSGKETADILERAAGFRVGAASFTGENSSPVSQVKQRIIDELNPRTIAKNRFKVSGVTDKVSQKDAEDATSKRLAAIEYVEPMFEALKSVAPEWVTPNFEKIAANGVCLFETNQRFLEAFMVGLNHEMERELLWNNVPFKPKGTFFKKFWSFADENQVDINPIVNWSKLGMNKVPGAGGAQSSVFILLVRGELLNHFPNTILYAAPAMGSTAIDESRCSYPVFSGSMGKDAAFFGFELKKSDIPNYFFVFQEQPAESRFGFDTADGAAFPASNGYASLDAILGRSAPASQPALPSSDATNPRSSADVATLTFRSLSRVAMRFSFD